MTEKRYPWPPQSPGIKDQRSGGELEIRPIGAEELPAFVRAHAAAFSEPATADHEVALARARIDPSRALAAYERGRMVATAEAHRFELTLPGSLTIPVAGVSWVGVLPTHRRRGILRALTARQLDDIVSRGEAMAVLVSTEAAIYGRFGYGPATMAMSVEIDPAGASFAHEVSTPGGLRLLDSADAAAVVPSVYERARRRVAGTLSRSAGWWEGHFLDSPSQQHGAPPRIYVGHETAAAEVDGFVAYRVEARWEHYLPAYTLLVEEVVAADPKVRMVLWKHCLGVDLVTKVHAFNLALDDPLRFVLADPRQLRVTRVSDFLWVRLLDIPAALAARRYFAADRLVFEVSDRFRPSAAGRYVLDAQAGGATCRRVDSSALPDLALDVADLGAAYLGGVSLTTLAEAGRVAEYVSGTVVRADALFRGETLPFCATHF